MYHTVRAGFLRISIHGWLASLVVIDKQSGLSVSQWELLGMRDCRSQSASSSQWKHNWGFFLAIFFMNKYLLRLLPFHQIWGSRAVCGHRQSAPLQAFSRWSPASQHRCFAPWPTKTRSLQDLIAKKHNAAFPRNDAKHIQNRLGELPFSVTFYSTSLGRSPGSEAQAVASKHWEFNAGWGESYTQHTHRNLMQRQGKQQWRLLNAIFFFTWLP